MLNLEVDMITHRQSEILEAFSKTDRFIKSRDLANSIGVSSRTIISDIKSINFELKQILNIYSQRGRGYRIEIYDDKKFKELLSYDKESIDLKIKKEILLAGLTKTRITQADIAENFYLSLSSLKIIIKKIREDLRRNSLDIKFTAYKTVEIIGDERKIRLYVKEVLLGRYFNPVENIFNKIWGDRIDFRQLNSILTQILERNSISISQEKIDNLLLHIIISSYRKKSVSYKDSEEKIIQQSFGYQIAIEIIKEFSEFLNIDSEVMYIANLLNNLCFTDEADDKYLRICKDIVEEIYQRSEIDLRNDQVLIDGLKTHIKSILNRIGEVEIDDGIGENIRKNYPLEFDLSIMVSKLIYKKTEVKLTETEISYLAIHLGAAILRANSIKSTMRVVIITNGFSIGRLIESSIKNKLDTMIETEIIMSSSYDKEKLRAADLVISTIRVNKPINKNTIFVNPILGRQELRDVSEAIGKFQQINVDIFKFFNEDLFFKDLKFKNSSQVLDFLTIEMEKRDYISKEIRNSIIEREKISSTEIGNLMAIPHALYNDTTKSQIAILILKEPILWKEERVQLVFLINISSKKFYEWKMVIEFIFEKIIVDNLTGELIKAKTFDEFKNILYRW